MDPTDDSLHFGATTLGLEVTRGLELRQRGLVPAEIREWRIDPDEGAFGVAPLPDVVARDDSAPVDIVYRPLVAGTHRAALRMRLESGREVTVQLEGRGVDARAVVEQAPDFGRPALGAVRRRALVLRNDEETPVPVPLSFTGTDAAEFAVTALLWLPPRSRATADMTWEPRDRPGPREAAVELVACPLCLPQQVPVRADAVEKPLVVSPDPVSVGAIAMDSEVRRGVVTTNATDEVITIDRFELDAAADPGFVLLGPALPLALLPLDSVDAEVRFSPVRAGAATASLELHSDAEPTPSLSVPVEAVGGGAQLIVAPARLGFRTVPAGARTGLVLTIQNGGDAFAPALRVLGVSMVGPAFELLGAPPAGTVLRAGERMDVTVVFRPDLPGAHEGAVVVDSDDPLAPSVVVPVSGKAGDPQPCELLATPPQLDFGGVLAGKRAVLGVKITNIGSAPCSLWGGRVEGDPPFQLGRSRDLVSLPPGGTFTTPVSFKPEAPGRYLARLLFETNRAAGVLEVPLGGGNDEGPCLAPEPSSLEFGEVRVDCGAREREGAWRNRCSRPVTVSSIELGAGTDEGIYSLVGTTATPAVVGPGDAARARVRFTPALPGWSYHALFAQGSEAELPLLMTLSGVTAPPAVHDETYVQPARGKLDLLLVLDNTASTKDKRPALFGSMASFLTYADGLGLDYRIGATTTGVTPAPPTGSSEPCQGGVSGGEAGRLFPVDRSSARILDPTLADRATQLQKLLNPGGCHSVKQGLEALRLALSPPLVDNADDPRTSWPLDGNLGLLRDDARLAIVVWSDDDDQSPGTVRKRLDALAALRPQSQVTFNAVVAPAEGCPGMTRPGLRYLAAVEEFGGFSANVCEADWSAPMRRLADDAFRPHDRFTLRARADPTTLDVTVDGVPARGWTYDATRRVLVFDVPPDPGQRVRIVYREPCPAP